MKASVLVVDDEKPLQRSLAVLLEHEGHEVHMADTGQAAVEFCMRRQPEVLLVDYRLPDMTGIEVLTALRRESVDTGVILMTAFANVPLAVEAMHRGAENFLTKPIDLGQLRLLVARTAEKVRLLRKNRALQQVVQREAPFQWLGSSASMKALRHQLEMLAQSPDATVLFLGESGTGKGHFARWLHLHGPRSEMPFVEFNCASLSSSLLESELFGHERGSFTDAKETKKGLLEVAQGGIVFLDEVADLPLELQPRLLKFLEDKRFRRIGGLHEIQVDVQIFTASNQDLQEKVQRGTFRKDLFYRLNVLPVHLAPLRGRREDIPLLANFFYAELCRKHGKPIVPLSDEVIDVFCRYPWPGNVRELRNVLERAFILGGFGSIELYHLPREFQVDLGTPSEPGEAGGLESLEQVEARQILRVLRATGGNAGAAARILQIARSTLFEKMKRYNLRERLGS
jgi:two-component system, NtrC family, response regulator AtoC